MEITLKSMKNLLGQVNLCVYKSYCVQFACDYDEARDRTHNFSSQTLLELMWFKLSQLRYYVCFCYGISVHENNDDTHLVDKSDKILSDYKTSCKSLQ